MNHRALFPKVAKRVAMVGALCALLGVVGCMTRPQAVMRPAGDVTSTSLSIDAPEDACTQFSCQP
jgi:hypothetical protein